MKTIHIVGVGMGAPTTQAEKIVASCEVLIGARGSLDVFERLGKPAFEGYKPEDVHRIIRQERAETFAVLVSGDVGFFSGARRLVSELAQYDVRLTAGVPSVCAFFARLGLPWQDAALISAHGCLDRAPLVSAVRRNHLTFCLTGGNAPEIGAILARAGFGELSVHVGENLGCPDERVFRVKASALQETQPMAVLLIVNEHFDASIPTGIPDSAFMRAEGVPMTKSEVRAVILSKLRLRPHDICYDIGAGTGSVTVEMALSAHQGQVFAIERQSAAVALTEENCRKFHVGNVTPILGSAPSALADLPAPDAVFIGGSGGRLPEIADALLQKNRNVRLVMAAIAIESVYDALTQLERAGLSNIEAVQVSVSRAEKRAGMHLLLAQNPIFIISGGGL